MQERIRSLQLLCDQLKASSCRFCGRAGCVLDTGSNTAEAQPVAGDVLQGTTDAFAPEVGKAGAFLSPAAAPTPLWLVPSNPGCPASASALPLFEGAVLCGAKWTAVLATAAAACTAVAYRTPWPTPASLPEGGVEGHAAQAAAAAAAGAFAALHAAWAEGDITGAAQMQHVGESAAWHVQGSASASAGALLPLLPAPSAAPSGPRSIAAELRRHLERTTVDGSAWESGIAGASGCVLPAAAAGRLAELGGVTRAQGGGELPGFTLPSGAPGVMLHWMAGDTPAALQRVLHEGASQAQLAALLGAGGQGDGHCFVLHGGGGEEEEETNGNTSTRYCFVGSRMQWCVLRSAASTVLVGAPLACVVHGRFPAAATGARAAASLLDITMDSAAVPVLDLFEGAWGHTHLADSQAVCEAAHSPGHSQLGAVMDTPEWAPPMGEEGDAVALSPPVSGRNDGGGRKGFMGGIRRMLSGSPSQRKSSAAGAAETAVAVPRKACAIWAHVFSAVVSHTAQEGIAVLRAPGALSPAAGHGQLRLLLQAAATGDAEAQHEALDLQDDGGVCQAAHALTQALVQCSPPARGCALTMQLPAAAGEGGGLQADTVSYVRPSVVQAQHLPHSSAVARFLGALQDGGAGLLEGGHASDSDSDGGGPAQGASSLDALWESVRCGAPELLPPVPPGVLSKLQVAVATARERAAASGVAGGALPLSLALDDTEEEGTITGLLLAGSAVLSPLLGGVPGAVMRHARAGMAEDVHAHDMGVPLTSTEATHSILGMCLPELLQRVPCDTLLGVLGALLTERKVVLLAASETGGAQPASLHSLSCCVLALAALLRPLAWAMPLLCPVPSALSVVLQSPVPLLVGVQALPSDWEADDECVLLALDTGMMHCSSGNASPMHGDDADTPGGGSGLPLSLLMQPPLMSHLHHMLAPGSAMVQEHMQHLQHTGCIGTAAWSIPSRGWQAVPGYSDAAGEATGTAAPHSDAHSDSVEAWSEVQDMARHVATQLQAYITAVLCSALHIGGRTEAGQRAAGIAARGAGGNEWPVALAGRGALWDVIHDPPVTVLQAVRNGSAVWHRDTASAERDETAHAAVALCSLAAALHHSGNGAGLLDAGAQLEMGAALQERGRHAEEPFWGRLVTSQMVSAWRNMWERSRQWAHLMAVVRPCDVAFVLQDVLVGAAEDREQLREALEAQREARDAVGAGAAPPAAARPPTSLRATRLSLARARRGSVSLTAASLMHSHGGGGDALAGHKSPLAMPAGPMGFVPPGDASTLKQAATKRPSSARGSMLPSSTQRLAPVLSPLHSASPAVKAGVLPASADAFWAQQSSSPEESSDAFSMSGEYASQYHSLSKRAPRTSSGAGPATGGRAEEGGKQRSGSSTSESDDDEYAVPNRHRAARPLHSAGSQVLQAAPAGGHRGASAAAAGRVRIRVEGGSNRTAMQWPSQRVGMAQDATAASPHYLARRGFAASSVPVPAVPGGAAPASSGWGDVGASSVWGGTNSKQKVRKVRLG